jgi:hypothetical protein
VADKSGDPQIPPIHSGTPLCDSLLSALTSSPPSSSRLTPLPLSRSPTPKTTLPEFKQWVHKVRDQHYMTLYSSSSDRSISHPYDVGKPDIGDIFLHKGGEVVRLWVLDIDGVWGTVQDGDFHPSLPDHRLYRASENNRPRWIHKKTVGTYRSRGKRYKCMSLNSVSVNIIC